MRNCRGSFLSGIFLLFFTITYGQQPTVPQAPGMGNKVSNLSVKETLTYVNNLLSTYNPFNSSIEVNMLTREISFIDKFSILTGKFSEVGFKKDSENIAFFCKQGNNCLRQTDVVTSELEPSRVMYTFGIKKNSVAVSETDDAIRKLNDMLMQLIEGNNSVLDEPVNSAVVTSHLKVINNAFSTYNSYGSVFNVIGKTLYWKSSVADISVDLENVAFYVNYENNWIVLLCIEQGCFVGTSFKDQYSMSLETSSGQISPDMEKVLGSFNAIRKNVLSR